MLNIKQRKERAFNDLDISSKQEAFEFVKVFFSNKPLLIKNSPESGEVTINEFLTDGTMTVVTNPEFQNENTFTVYGLLDKYIEIDLKIEEVLGPGYFKCSVDRVRRAIAIRKDIRFKLSAGEVFATNFRISRHTIDLTNYSIPTRIKVLLDQFQSQNSRMSDIVKVGIFENEDRILKHIKRTGETLFIEDMSNPDSYFAINNDFMDLAKILGDELDKYIKKNIERGYKSMIISPVIYLTDSENSVPFAYIQLISKSDNFTLEKVLELKDHIFKLIDRIRDANTILLPVHQEITDISKSGAKLKITDRDLKKYVTRAKGFIFDIVFKLQAPITMYGDIKSSFTNDDGDIFVGVDFAGNSSREDEMKRFNDIITPMTKEYKNKLLLERKAGRNT